MPLYSIFKKNGVKFHGYADDTQFYIETSESTLQKTKDKIVNVLTQITKWLFSHKLKINAEKTEIIIFGHNHTVELKIDVNVICSSLSVRDLGVLLDCNLSFNDHFTKICKECYLLLRNISKNRKCRDTDTCKRIIILFISFITVKFLLCLV